MQNAARLLKEKLNSDKFVIILLITIGLILYANTFNNEMFWDDQDSIINNAYVHDWKVGKFFTENLIAGANLVSNYWRPVLLMVFSIEWHIWGDSVMGYHLVNTAVHIANAIFLFFILQKLFGQRLLALSTSLIFLIHPVQTEAVTYVAGLGDPLSALFTFAAIWFYFKFRDQGKYKPYFYAALFYILAVLSKDTAAAGVALIGLVDFFYLRNLPFWPRLKKSLLSILPFAGIFILYMVLRATILNFQNSFNLYNEANEFTTSFTARLATFFEVMVEYMHILFYPVNQHMERLIQIPEGFFEPQVLAGAGITAGLLLTAVLTLKKYPAISFGIFWFFLRLFPHSNLAIPSSGLMYEHWLYLPLIGIFLAIFYILLYVIPTKADGPLSYTMMTVIILSFLFLGYRTVARNNDWQDPITLYSNIIRYNQTSYRVYNNLGMAYADKDMSAEALENYKTAVSLNPEIAVAYHNIANTYKEQSEYDKAEQYYLTAIEKDPAFTFSYNALADLYINKLKDSDRALARLESLLPQSPDKLNLLLLLSQIAYNNRDYEATLKFLLQAAKISPEDKNISDAIRVVESIR